MRRWVVIENLARCVRTHEGHTVLCASAADARFVVESANALIDMLDPVETHQMSLPNLPVFKGVAQ